MNLKIKAHTIIFRLVILISLAIAVGLAVATWDINFWPTDTKVYYFDAAVKIPHIKHLSQIHESVDAEKIRWLHGKEIFILCVSWMQRLMNDFETLRPFILVCIISIAFSSIFIYYIAQKLWGVSAALLCYVAFTGSMWPYIYIMFAKHQPVGLFFFLLALSLLFFANGPKARKICCYLSGLSMGLALFSSTVSSLYLPYYIAGWFYIQWQKYKEKEQAGRIKNIFIDDLLMMVGVMTAFAFVNWPDVIHNIRCYKEYVDISGSYNHFFYNQAFLQQWFPGMNVAQIRGGWEWIIKYFFVIMPVLFQVYLVSLLYLIARSLRKTSWMFKLRTLILIILSLSSPLMAETARVAQYGANYFPSIIGIVLLIGYACYLIIQSQGGKPPGLVKRIAGFLLFAAFAVSHVFINTHAFVTDVYPCRMATTFLSEKIEELNIKKLYTYMHHPHRNHFILCVNPDLYEKFRFVPIKYIIQPKKSYIMVPPVTGNSIYIASISTYVDFDDDIFLNELLRKGTLENYSVASYKTLANSRIWLHEEEILSYRNLILNHTFEDNDLKARVWLLDGEKVASHMNVNVPIKDYLDLQQKELRNIGTKNNVYIYEGYTGKVIKTTKLKNVLARLHKIGNPTDSLVTYVYRVDDKQIVWVPHSEHFMSKPLTAKDISTDTDQGLAVFNFNPPLELKKGSYFFVIYRTGSQDDQNFYRIHHKYLGMK